jgi:F-type H+-transporting ATPase subunit delta
VTSRGAATRYARALFDIALAEGTDLLRVQKDLGDFARLVGQNDSLKRVLTNPAIPVARKRGVIEQLIARAGSLQPTVAKVLLMLAERDRLAILPEVVEVFDARLMDHQKVIRARIVTAVPLPPERIAALTDGLKRATGSNVLVETSVDASLIGGAVARIGSTVYDGSITRQLERMKDALTSAADA